MAKANANTEVVENTGAVTGTAEGTGTTPEGAGTTVEGTGTTPESAGTTPEGAGTVEAAQEGPKMVRIQLYKDKSNTAPVFVSVNGERFIIQRGVDVEVPEYVAEVLEHSRKQDIAAMEYREGLAKRYETTSEQ